MAIVQADMVFRRYSSGNGVLRLLRQMLTESVALSCCGAVFGATPRNGRHA